MQPKEKKKKKPQQKKNTKEEKSLYIFLHPFISISL